MLWTILVILLILWALGFTGLYGASIGGLFHIILVLAVVVLIINLLTGRRAV